jgi:two-component system chemotaxis sensor kinase CheA
MSGFEELKSTFFDEANEGLVALEAGLNEIREGTGSEDTVHAIFRAVHSIKGGAGVFGFSELIEFAHAFETVLDLVRQGKLNPTPEVVDVLFRANDTVTDLVGKAREGSEVEPGFGNDCRSELELLAGGGAEQTKSDEEPAPAELEGLVFTPVRVDEPDNESGDIAGMRRYSITFGQRRR